MAWYLLVTLAEFTASAFDPAALSGCLRYRAVLVRRFLQELTMFSRRLGILSLALAACMMLPRPGQATLFTGSSGSLSASADFSLVNGQLQVLLTNTSTADTNVPTDVLTAVFFNIASDPAFTSISAVLGQGSTVIYGSQPAGGVVGGEWGYGNNLSGAPGGANQGISSSGLGGVFGDPTFPGANLADPAALDGVQYGIVSAGWKAAKDNGGITGSGGLIKNSVLFTLGNVPLNFDPAKFITNVSFQYGTDLSEPRYTASCSNCGPTGGGGNNTAVPEPASLLLLGTAFALLMARTMRRRA
jgi:hypothetical protein